VPFELYKMFFDRKKKARKKKKKKKKMPRGGTGYLGKTVSAIEKRKKALKEAMQE